MRFLVAIRFGISALCLGILLRRRIRAAGVPIRFLVNLIAGVDMHVGAFRLVVRVQVDTRVANDIALVVTVSTVACTVAAGRNFERDGVGRKRCLCHVSLPELVCTLCVPMWTAAILDLDAGSV